MILTGSGFDLKSENSSYFLSLKVFQFSVTVSDPTLEKTDQDPTQKNNPDPTRKVKIDLTTYLSKFFQIHNINFSDILLYLNAGL